MTTAPDNNKQEDSRLRQHTLRLLKKGQKGIIHAVFSRFGLFLILLMVQIGVLVAGILVFTEYLKYFVTISEILSVFMVLMLLNSRRDPTAKLTWLVIFAVLPVFGGLLYLLIRSDLGHRAVRSRVDEMVRQTRPLLPGSEIADRHLEEADPGAASLARYLRTEGGFRVRENTSVKFFPLGEDMWAEMLTQLEQAEKFIFLEFFIVDEGEMWGSVLDILARKAAEGVEVRMMYDGTCEFTTLPHDYPARLRKLGIQCKEFSPIVPLASTHYNYRDHRKILVIDGHTAFTGGVNLADEYINRIERFGHWKDTAVMLKGDAVPGFTRIFLQLWSLDVRNPEFAKYLVPPEPVEAEGFVIPYADCPLDDDRVGEWVYMHILNRATRYVYIMTPYLILDGELEAALRFAAERGVDVRLILPGIPDKKVPYALAKTHYAALMASGVKVYEYTPGFVHAKVFVSDDREAVVGTINLDYRSLYHHFECAAYMHSVPCVPEIREDFLATQQKCHEITKATIYKSMPFSGPIGFIMKVIAPLL